jgi:RHS repeat-associated protein
LDPGTNRLIIFGGGDVVNGVFDPVSLYRNDVWVLTNANGLGGTPSWTLLIDQGVAGSPSPRLVPSTTSASVYVSSVNDFVIFGGQIGPCSGSISTCASSSVSNEVWILSNANGTAGVPSWTKSSATGGPQRLLGNDAYDSSTDTAINYGGGLESAAANLPSSADTWLLANVVGTNCAISNSISLNPNSGQQGQQNLSVVISGQSTHFLLGTTIASFGIGITVTSLTVNSATSATAMLNIDPRAAAGSRTVVLKTGTEVVTLNNGFTVTPGTPVLTQVNPSTGQQGQQNLSVAITGQFTHFAQGTSQVSFGAGITVASLTVSSATAATAVLNIAPAATLGSRSVTLMTGSEAVTLTNAFTVNTANNQAPIVNAGSDQTITFPNAATLSGSVTDDGLPIGANLTTTWSTVTPALTATWVQLSPTGGPPAARQIHAAVFDPNTDRLITFGGSTASAPAGTNDVWVLTNADGLGGTPQWSMLAPVPDPVNGVPAPRSWHSAVYDSHNNRMIVFGGCLGNCQPVANDVWVLTNANGIGGSPAWIRLLPTGSIPAPRNGHSAVYDPGSNTMIVFGGANSTSSALPEVWVLRNANGLGGTPVWNQLNPSGNFPPGQANATAVYDTATNRMTVFGGNGTPGVPTNAVWLLTNANGTGGTPVWANLIAEGALASPPVRINHTAVYDPQANRMTIFGGRIVPSNSVFNDTWVLTNANGLGPAAWNQIFPTGALPTGREALSAVLNIASNRMMIFGGGGTTALFNDSWVLTNSNGGVLFSNPTQVQPDISGTIYPVMTVANFGGPGTYQLRLTGSDSALTGSSDITVTVQGSSTLQSVSPNAGPQGQQGLSVTLTGQNTSWLQGTTVASFGSGITISSFTVSSPTTAAAVINIASTAAVGSQTVTITTGSEVETLTNGFTITAGTPVLVSVNPNSGQQGQQNLSVAVTGQFTHFAQGTTIANFGAGVQVNSLTVSSPTTATAVLNIGPAPNANAGVALNFFPNTAYKANTAAIDVTLGTTGYTIDSFETTALIPGLTIQLSGGVPTTTWTSLPNLFDENTCGVLTQNQAWDGTQTASNQILNQVTNCNVAPGLANLVIFNYAPGATSFGIGLSNFQSVNPPSPRFPVTNHELFVNGVDMGVLETLAGAAWSPGLTRNAYLRIDGTNGGLITSVGIENLLNGPVGDFLMFDHLAILPATTGARDVTMATNTEIATLANGFTVNTISPAPAIASVSPNTGQQGQQNLSVALSGQFTNWVQGTTTASFGPSITLVSLTVNSPTSATAVINIRPTAAVGSQTVTMTTGSEIETLANGFAVTASTPVCTLPSGIVGWWPGDGNTNDIIGGDNGTLVGGTTFAPGEVVQAFSFTKGIDSVLIPDNPSFHFADFTIEAWVNLQNPLSVKEDAILTKVDNLPARSGPYTGLQLFLQVGTHQLAITLNGSVPNSTIADEFISLASVQVGAWTHVAATRQGNLISFYINGVLDSSFVTTAPPIANTDPLVIGEFYDTALNPPFQNGFNFGGLIDEVSVYNRALPAAEVQSIFAAGSAGKCKSGIAGTPRLLSLSPNNGQQGQQSLTVTINGGFTHFAQGITSANFGTGITVTSLTVNSPTSATVAININPTAAVGSQTVSMTTGGEVALLANGFTVTGTPVLLSINPNSGQQGQTLPVTITGQFTHFVQGVTQVQIGAGVGICSVTVMSPTTLIAQVSVSITAAPGTLPVTVQTGLELVSLTNGFAVVAATQPSALTWTQLSPAGVPPNPQIAIANNTFLNPNTNRWGILNLGNTISVLVNPDGAIGTPQWTTITALPDPVNGFPSTLKSSSGGSGPPAYDPINNRLILFGGCLGHCGPTTNELWVLSDADGSQTGQTPTWSKLAPTGGPPASRTLHVAVYDATTNSMTIFGGDNQAGTVYSDVWVLSNANGLGGTPAWSQLNPQTGPGALTNATAAYDSATNQMIVFGGSNRPATLNSQPVETNAVWALSNANGHGGTPVWTNLVAQGSPGAPPPRALHAAVYDACTTRMTIFAGTLLGPQGAFNLYNDTWVLANANTRNGTPTWMELNPIGGPPIPRWQPATVLNTASARMTIWGGETQQSLLSDTWILGGFTGVPEALLSVTPGIAQPGQTVNVALTGQLTNFQQGTTLLNLGTGITVSSMTVNSPINVTAALSIDPAAAPGPRAVIATTGTDTVRLDGGFSVVAAGTPTLLSATPNSGMQGQNSLSVAIAGQNTGFVQGTTVASFGAGITVASLTVNSPTNATAVINIDPVAAIGARTITLTTGSEVDALSNGFTVVSGTLPTITTVSPNSGQQGQGGPVGIAGQNTHFLQGTTQVNFGAGITVSAITVTCATCLTAQLQIDPAAAPGPRTVTVTTGIEVVTLLNGFTVLPGTPILTSLIPASGQQGQSLSISVTGQFTHFTQGATQVSLGTGVTVSSVRVSSSTSLTAQILIDLVAIVGTKTLTVTTGTEVVSVANVFNVLAATPVLQSVSPGGGTQGQQNLSVTLTGLNTHFVQGTSITSFGAGITVVSLTVSSATSATAVINISQTAAIGSNTVTVTTGSEVVGLAGFMVTAPPVVISSLNPGGTSQGAQNVPVAITGANTHWAQGTTQASFGAGITLVSLTVTNATAATAVINVDPAATIGPRTVTMTTGTEVAQFANGFTIVAGVAGITQIAPASGPQGQTGLSVAITGQFTHFAQGTTTASFGASITVTSLTVSSPTSLIAVVSIAPTASLGAQTVAVTTGTEVVTAANAFIVTAGTPILSNLTPNAGQQGQQNLTVSISALNTHFVQGTTSASFGSGITIISLTVSSPTTAVAVINIDPAALPGAQTVTLTTGTEVASLASGFTVTAGTPVLTTASPNSGQQGQQSIAVTLTGQFTHFAQGTTTASFGAGITVATLTVNSTTSATAVLNIASTAVAGPRSVTVSTGAESVTLPNGFSVVQASTGPAILSITPNTGVSAQSVTVTITAQNTHFLQGTTQANFGPGVSVGSGLTGQFSSVTVTSTTTATAQVNVPANAILGLRAVTLQTGSETATLVNGFSVIGPASLSSISPTHAQPGQTISVAITGLFTNFQQGVSQANFGAGISVGGTVAGSLGPITVTSLNSATAQLTISSNATAGLRTPITVVTGTEQAAYSGTGFLVVGAVTGPGPIVSITSPAEGAEVTAPTPVTGTVTSPNLASWTLEYEASGSTAFTQFASGTSSTVTGTFDPTLTLNGMAQIRLTGVDQSGQTTSAIVDVVVTRNVKVGNFTLSFNDLTVPVAGIPIQIIRTYDSRIKSVGDFGFGWNLNIKTSKIETNTVLGSSWAGTTSGGAFPTYCVQPTTNQVVSVRLSDGTVYQFQPTLTSQTQCQQLVPPATVDMTFLPIGSTPPNVSLTTANSTGLFISGSFPGPIQLLDFSDTFVFDPDQYTLTLATGQQILISRTFGVQSIADTNGNTLTFTTTGISSSNGKSVSFVRDTQGRITSITDPSGNVLAYAYDGNGDLATFTDPLQNISTFSYDGNHDLISFRAPTGDQPLRNVYDDSGRLIQEIDAFGHTVDLTHNLAANTETVSDFLGNLTSYVYDAHGNIISQTNALGGLTTATFDANDNKLTETNALGKIRSYTYDANNNRLTETDPLSNTTSYTYNTRNQVLTITDALSRVTTNTYDANGNLLSTQDPAGGTTSYTYNSQGLRLTSSDPLGGVTSYAYDAVGNLTQQTDALGNVSTYTYDLNGNRLSETRTRTTASGTETLVTSYQYDGLDRVIQTTYSDGSTTQVQYNSIGKQSATTDQLGRQTLYQYDPMGRLTLTTYPDSTSESSTYDANGNRASSTDRGGRTTTYSYDPLKRLVQTTYADGASTSTGYDAIGEVTSATDARGNVTKYLYDGAGRRTSVTDALTHVTSFTYDAVGDQLSMTDASTNTTQYQYDPLNRRTKTIYPDSTSDGVAYDALGRTISKTDQAGVTTQFLYDKLGRLIQVTDALGQPTKYSYNEVGNRITQTDANTHTTTFAYDKLGRRTTRTLPLGMSESMSYDATGNLTSKTDFNGKTTTYSYDLVNRLLSKTPDASFAAPAVTFGYTQTGQRASMGDASGTTSYSYDLRDRLTQKATPFGNLTYTYDAAGNLVAIRSSNANGTSVNYSYDTLNRISSVVDNRLASGTTTYSYDNVGNLQGYSYPNGIQTAYSYNTLNRLTNVAISKGSALASYAYQLGPTGNRTQVSELGGRSVSYSYDSLYRLTAESILGATMNGSIGYQYDPVGNRLQRTSTVAPVPSANYSYDANDRLTADAYDSDGNTTASGGNAYSYDFENHLATQTVSNGAVTIVYDGDGNRVSKAAGGVTTNYLVDDRNLTGYAQVLEELSGGAVQRVYTYGPSRISQSQSSGTSFYGYDGHGSVRLLTDATGAVTDRYDYDAFGNIISQTGTTPNVYLYSGEQNDPNLNLYYLRARYLNQSNGRFWTVDRLSGHPDSPISMHKYLYVGNEPVLRLDPSGNEFDIASLSLEITVASILLANPSAGFGQSLSSQGVNGVNTLLPASGEGYYRYYDAGTGDKYYYGRLSTIVAIESIASEWYAFSADSDVGPTRIGIGDISKQGGGSLATGQPPGHNHPSGHTLGLEVDIRPQRQDGFEQPTTVSSPSYSFVRNLELVAIISKYHVRVILFGDHMPGVTFDGAHNDHLHVAFY